MQFAGKDFLSMPAPPGYKAGVGRGAVGFSTTAERASGDAAFPGRRPGRTRPEPLSHERMADAPIAVKPTRENSEAEAIYAAIESKLAAGRRKKRTSVDPLPSETAPLKTGLENVTIDEWASFPDASDLTHRNKRLREEERALRRSYAVPDSLILAQQAEEQRLANLRRRRIMLEGMIKAEPRNPEGFIALARLEQEAARHKKARLVIEKGTLMCPTSPEVWLESIELHPNSSEARAVVAKACRACPNSERLWLRAIALEPTEAMKAQVAHEGLLNCSQSLEMWLLSAQLEPDVAAKRDVLRTALDFIPDNEQLWLALIDAAEPHDRRELLRKAQKRCPTSLELLLRAARLADDAELQALVDEAVVQFPRQHLMQTLFALEPEDGRLVKALTRALKPDIADFEYQALSPATRDLIFAALSRSEQLYVEWAKTRPDILEEAILEFPHSALIWRTYIAAGGDVLKALARGDAPTDESLLQTAVKSLLQRGDIGAATQVLETHTASHPAMLAELVEIYELSGEFEKALSAAEQGIAQWSDAPLFYLAKARLDPDHATSIYQEGLAKVPQAHESRPLLWLHLALRRGSAIARRATLSQAIREHPQYGALWLERVRLEKKEGLPITQVLEDALRACAGYGLLWWEAIEVALPGQRRAKLVEAVKGSKGDLYVLIAGGLLFAKAGQRDKARDWFEKARAVDPSNGDVVLWMKVCDLADASMLEDLYRGTACNGIEWSPAYRRGLIQRKPQTEVVEELVKRLQNPF